MATTVRQPRVFRPVGRPSMEQQIMEATLLSCAIDYQIWQKINNRIASGNSINSWVVQIKKTRQNLFLTGNLGAVRYIDFVLFGRGRGKPPKVQDIMRWINQKGIRVPGKTNRQLAFAIATSIGQNGTLPPHLSRQIITRMVSANTSTVLRKSTKAYVNEKSAEFMEELQAQYNLANAQSKNVKFKVVTGQTKTRVPPVKTLVDKRYNL